MVYRIETTGTVGPDGSLTIDQPLGIPPGRHNVVVLIDEAPAVQEASDWPSFINATYGSLADIPIVREPQGEYEHRDPIE